MKCPEGHDNTDAARYCSRCGRPLGGDPIRSATRVTPLMQLWRQLSSRVTRREARRLLGEPARVEFIDDPLNPTAEVWTYQYEPADGTGSRIAGSVVISISGQNVVSWTEPDWPALAANTHSPSTSSPTQEPPEGSAAP